MQITAVHRGDLLCILRPVLLLGALTSAACQSLSTNIVEPSKSKCDIAVKNNTSELPASGGNGTITVTTTRDCLWNASAEAPWISLSAKEGQGQATVNYSASANPNGIPRRASVVVAEQTIEVAQAAAECRFQTSPSSVNVEAAGTSASIAMTVPNGCRWTARSDVPWIVSVVPADGEGEATVRVTVSPNSGEARTGAVAIGTATVRFNQAAAPLPPSPPPPPSEPPPPPPPTPPACNFAVAPMQHSASAAGEQVAITVTAGAGCAWTATTTTAWIAIASASTGSGNGSVQLTVSSNSGAARTGTVIVAGQAVTISQAAAPAPPPPPPACTYKLSDPTRTIVADGQDLAVNVTAPADCAWTVTSDAAWITVADAGSGTGNGSVRLTVGRNTGAARTGTVRIATETLSVQQAAAPITCTYQIKPASYDAGRGSETITIDVTADSACAWAATTDSTWVVIDAGQHGTGNGTVRLIVSANTGPERTAVVTIAGTAFRLRQESGCSASIKPTSYDSGRGPDDVKVAVTIDPGCTWTAASDVSWVTIAEGSTGIGNGTVRLLLQENTGAARAVTLTIAGRPFALTQEGP